MTSSMCKKMLIHFSKSLMMVLWIYTIKSCKYYHMVDYSKHRKAPGLLNKILLDYDRYVLLEFLTPPQSAKRYIFIYMLLSCHVHVSEQIHTLYLPECQGTSCSKQARNLKFN